MRQMSLVITRGQLGTLGIVLAGMGLLVTVLGLLAQFSFSGAALLGIVLAGAGTALWALATPDDFRDFITGRHIRHGTVAILSTILLIGIVSVAYIIVQRARIISDITIDNRFSLNERTLELLRAVARSPRPIRILGFYRPQDLVQRQIDDQYWQLYEASSEGMITRQYVDPIREPGIAAPFVQALNQNYYVFVGFVNPDDTLDLTSVQVVANEAQQEKSMTEALARLLAGGSFKVYFEDSLQTLDAAANDQRGMSILNNNLRSNGVITDRLSLQELAASGGSIPRDASALIIARPQRQPTAAEQQLIADYLDRGGRLFIAADYFPTDDIFMQEGSAFNEFIWERFGLRMLDAIVVDTRSQGPSPLDVLSAQVIAENSIAAGVNLENDPSSGALFHFARAIQINPTPPVPNGSVVLSSDLSWGETDTRAVVLRNEFVADIATDIRGPMNLVAFADDPATGARIVLVGDGDFLTNGYTSEETQFYARGNAALFLGSIGWLTGFTEAVQFAPQAYITTPVLFSGGEQLDVIAFLTVVVMPGSMLLAAVVIYFRRYRQL